MPEIFIPAIPGLRNVGMGLGEQDIKMLQQLAKERKIELWGGAGDPAELEKSWMEFLLRYTPPGTKVMSGNAHETREDVLE